MMDCSDAGRLGAEKRRQYERERICAVAREMNAKAGRPDDPRLYPPLILTKGDRL